MAPGRAREGAVTRRPRDPDRQVWMRHPITGGRAVVTVLALESVWKERGWLWDGDATPVDLEADRRQALAEARAELDAADRAMGIDP